MKIIHVIRFLALALVLALAYIGCSLFGTSIEVRIDSFLTDLNDDRSNIYLNFHPTLSADYDAIKNGTLPDWSTLFPTAGYTPYVITGLNTSDPTNVTGTIDESGLHGWGPKPIVFRMAKDGFDWMIEELDLDGVSIVK